MKIRVPDTFQLGAILPFPTFLASRKINNLRVFNNPEYSDSSRLHHFRLRAGAGLICKCAEHGTNIGNFPERDLNEAAGAADASRAKL